MPPQPERDRGGPETARVLLDANVLIAATVANHVHHARADAWLRPDSAFALCPIVEGALVRFFVRVGAGAASARAVLAHTAELPGYGFWADDFTYADADLSGIVGHRQVTDAYLAQLAARHGGVLATFDEALARAYPKAVTLVP